MRALIYARVSSDRQRERHTIDSQMRLLPEHAEREGWSVLEVIKEDGFSGETVDDRPGFRRVLELAAQRAFDILLVIDQDRLTRSRKSAEGALVFDHLREHGIKIAIPGQGLIDLNDEDQDFFVGIRREMAKWEKRKILRRMLRGKREAALQGRRYGCRDPYGLEWNADPKDPMRGAYGLVSEEASLLRRIFEMAVTERLGVGSIVSELNAEGLRTRPSKKHPEGGRWARSTVRKLLRSRTPRGELHVFKKSDKPVVIPVPAIVGEETWRAAQDALVERRPEVRWKHGRQYLLGGIATCGVCGYHMWVVNPKQGHGSSAYYRCATTNAWRHMGLSGPCGNRHHRVDVVDEAVWERVVEVLGDAELLAKACTVGAAQADAGVDWESQRAACERRLSELEALERDHLARVRRGLLSSEACDRELGELARERRQVIRNRDLARAEIARAGEERRTIDELRDRANVLLEGLGEAMFDDRRKLVRLLVPRAQGGYVRLHADGGIEIRGLLPVGAEARVLELELGAQQTRRSGKR